MTDTPRHTPGPPACRGCGCFCPESAAAPAMREALERIANSTEGHPVDAARRDRIYELARAALALAETVTK